MSDLAVKLEQLAINEVSGVDDPANEVPGWLVMKSRDPEATALAEKAIKACLGDLEAVEEIRKALGSDEDAVTLIKAAWPEAVKLFEKARLDHSIVQYAADQLGAPAPSWLTLSPKLAARDAGGVTAAGVVWRNANASAYRGTW